MLSGVCVTCAGSGQEPPRLDALLEGPVPGLASAYRPTQELLEPGSTGVLPSG